ncbi:unnamed protein product [Clonostachys solani]|uniref:NAD-dependent epimerase/dehydratase domain-containing protein n=1 Tax=Clonostachys solani TaxID=160281 RepID=A0A9N9Z0P6_9HYPO|nr:unnamed protein product [Clonostachys solani]
MPVVPANGLILVTGVNGFVASVLAKVCLDQGYYVRGTVRSIAKHQPLLSTFGPKFSLVEVPDIFADNAFDEAIKGVDGVAHVAANTQFTPDPSLIDEAVKGITNLLAAAAKESSVKRVVVTSSKASCMYPKPGIPYQLTPETYNQEAMEEFKLPFDGKNPLWRGMVIYCVAKATAEQKAFEWVRENKPQFVLNTVVPNLNFGTVPALQHLGFISSSSLIESAVRGIAVGPAIFTSEWFVNVEDTALLHLGALTLEEVQNERILAMAGPFSWTKILEIIQKLYPERESILASVDEPAVDIGHVDNGRSIEILRKMGKAGFRDLEETIVANMLSVIEAESLPTKPSSRADDLVAAMAASAQA